MTNHLASFGALTLCAFTLISCTSLDQDSDHVLGAIWRKESMNARYLRETAPSLYCYETLGELDCYHSAQPHMKDRLKCYEDPCEQGKDNPWFYV